jgi:glycosyltransferase involved in cell wall biosynthesis
VCNEIVVIDSGSKDDTVNIAKSLGAIVHTQSYLGDGPQKHHGVQYATNDWILSIDADERLDEDAITAIDNLTLDNTEFDAFSFHRKNFVGKRWIKAAGFYPDTVVRLYHKQNAHYRPKKAHSSVEANKVLELNAHIQHFTYKDYAYWIDRINALSTRDAWAMYERGVQPSSVRPILHAIAAIFRKLILKGGLFQGTDGLTVTITTAFHAYMKYLKLNELYDKKRRDQSD